MLTNNMFKQGDIVDIKPYKDIDDHKGIPKYIFDSFYKHNPHEIIRVSYSGYICLKYFPYIGWHASALVLHGENATLPDITGLI